MVPVLGVVSFVLPIAGIWPLEGHWLPANVNDHGGIIDSLFMFILYLTGAIFIGTGLVLSWYLYKYDGQRNREPVKYVHGSHTLEVIWSIIPAATLLFIAIYQMNAWADAKLRRPIDSPGRDGLAGTADDVLKPPIVEVTGRQFEWRIRYAGKDGRLGTRDDLHTVNDLHLPVDEEVVIQDVVPGMKQFVWFRANTEGVFDIVCAELCGWGHYKMRGRLTLESREEFDQWLAQGLLEQERDYFVPAAEGNGDE
jgi:cytochrome c oxidase subunit 2